MTSNPYEMMGQLPSRVPYARRYKVNHRVLGKVVEFRVLPKSATEDQKATYYLELEELLALDHPCFPPVLERGTVRKRQAYVVPLRDHLTIPERIAAHTFYPPQAFAAVSSLAGGMAAQHDQMMTAGPFEPSMVSWDDRAGTAYHLQRRHQIPKFLSSGEHPFPNDVLDFENGTPRADVFHWGFFAYFLLSRGKYPYEEAGHLRPLSAWGTGVPRYLQVAVEASLSWAPDDRPRNGAALQKVLLVGGVGGLTAEDPAEASPPTEPKPEPKAPPAIDQSASQAFHAFLADVDEIHLSLGPGTGTQEAVQQPAVPIEPEPETEEPEEDDVDLSMEVYQSGSGLAALTLPEARDESDEPEPKAPADEDPDTTGEFAGALHGLETNADLGVLQPSAAPPPQTSVGLVGCVALVLGLAGGWAGRGVLQPAKAPLVFHSQSQAKAPPRARPKPPPRETTDGSAILALSPSKASPYRKDSQVMRLLKTKAVAPDRVKKTWKTIRSLVVQGRMPPVLSDGRRLVAMRRAFEADAAAGPREIGAFLDDMRTVLGPGKESDQ